MMMEVKMARLRTDCRECHHGNVENDCMACRFYCYGGDSPRDFWLPTGYAHMPQIDTYGAISHWWPAPTPKWYSNYRKRALGCVYKDLAMQIKPGRITHDTPEKLAKLNKTGEE